MGSCASQPTAAVEQPQQSDEKMATKASSPKSEAKAEPKSEAKAEENVVVVAENENASAVPAEEAASNPEEDVAMSVFMADKVALSDADLDMIFTNAHTANGFTDKPVDDALLQKAVELAQLAPTAFNSCPMRLVFIKSAEGKEKLSKCLMPGNVEKTLAAPVTAIVCIDHEFYEHLDTLCPAFPGLRERFASNPASTEGSMIRNGNLQGGYLIMALRSLGLNVGPMSGFDNAAVDVAFLEGSSWKSNFLLNIGYSDADKNYPRAPRLSFEVASQFA